MGDFRDSKTYEEVYKKELEKQRERAQEIYNEMMSGTNCHCGKDGHPLNSMNCPVHGYEIRKKIKMIREEALRKLYKVNENNILNSAFLDKLEALGLIEFTVNENEQEELIERAKMLSSEGYMVSYSLNSINELVYIIKGLLKVIDKKE